MGAPDGAGRRSQGAWRPASRTHRRHPDSNALSHSLQFVGRRRGEHAAESPGASERLEALRTEASRPSSIMGTAAAAMAHGAHRMHSSLAAR